MYYFSGVNELIINWQRYILCVYYKNDEKHTLHTKCSDALSLYDLFLNVF